MCQLPRAGCSPIGKSSQILEDEWDLFHPLSQAPLGSSSLQWIQLNSPHHLDVQLCPEPVKLLSRVRLFAIPWTVAYQAPPSMEFSREEFWSGLPFPSPGDLPDSGIEPRFPALQADALPSELPAPTLSYSLHLQSALLLRLFTVRLLLSPHGHDNVRSKMFPQ